jgi:cardiolipin synthase A/B
VTHEPELRTTRLPATALAEAAADAVCCLPPALAAALAAALDGQDEGTPAARARVRDAVPTPAYRQAVLPLLTAWAQAPALPGATLALAVRAATGAATAVRAEQTLDIVWTGPVTDEVPVRRTRQVLLDVIDGAVRRLLLVSFAAHRVPVVVDALARAVARGVHTDLVLETTRESAGRLTSDAAAAFADLGDAVGFYAWPATARSAHTQGAPAVLHAKAAMADGDTALVTSANLTGSAIEANMELGLLVRGGPIPRRLHRHFERLIDGGVLARVLPPAG